MLKIDTSHAARGCAVNSATAKRGFGSMDPQRQREIASLGGRAAHQSGRAHEFTSDEAREAGRKGGLKRGRNKKA